MFCPVDGAWVVAAEAGNKRRLLDDVSELGRALELYFVDSVLSLDDLLRDRTTGWVKLQSRGNCGGL